MVYLSLSTLSFTYLSLTKSLSFSIIRHRNKSKLQNIHYPAYFEHTFHGCVAMDSDISRIRREKWLQHKNQNHHQQQQQMIDSTSLSSPITNSNKVNPNKKRQNSSPLPESAAGIIINNKVEIDLTFSSDDENYDKNEEQNGIIQMQSSSASFSSSSYYKRPKTISTSSSMSSSSSSSKSTVNKNNNTQPNNDNAYHHNNTPTPTFSILTYNIWFGQAHPSKRMMEISNIIANFQSNNKPLFIGLQEVTNELLNDLSPLLQSMGYEIITQDDCFHSYGVAIAVLTSRYDCNDNDDQKKLKKDIPLVAQVIASGFHPYRETMMGRGLLWVHGRIKNFDKNHSSSSSSSSSLSSSCSSNYEVLFTTTHLESFIPKQQYTLPYADDNHNGSKARKSQIQEAVTFCYQYQSQQQKRHNMMIKASFITGDLNWDDERKRKVAKGTDEPLLSIVNDNNSIPSSSSSSLSSQSWIDAWKDCNHNQDGYTYDAKLNPMLKGSLRRRFDRCLYYIHNSNSISNKNTNIDVQYAQLVGTDAIEGIEWKKEVPEYKYGKPTGATTIDLRPVCPSDHFGLFVQFGGG